MVDWLSRTIAPAPTADIPNPPPTIEERVTRTLQVWPALNTEIPVVLLPATVLSVSVTNITLPTDRPPPSASTPRLLPTNSTRLSVAVEGPAPLIWIPVVPMSEIVVLDT